MKKNVSVPVGIADLLAAKKQGFKKEISDICVPPQGLSPGDASEFFSLLYERHTLNLAEVSSKWIRRSLWTENYARKKLIYPRKIFSGIVRISADILGDGSRDLLAKTATSEYLNEFALRSETELAVNTRTLTIICTGNVGGIEPKHVIKDAEKAKTAFMSAYKSAQKAISEWNSFVSESLTSLLGGHS